MGCFSYMFLHWCCQSVGWGHWKTFTGLAVTNSHKHNIEHVRPFSHCQDNCRGEMVSTGTLSKHNPSTSQSRSEIKTYPSSQQCFDSVREMVEVQKMWGAGQRRRDQDRLRSRLRLRHGGRKTDRGTERVSRVADCRADGSWYGGSSGQASSVPSRPPGATQNSHPNTLRCFAWERH